MNETSGKPGTKSEVLEWLGSRVTKSVVLPQERTTARDWLAGHEDLVKRLDKRGWLDVPLIVRSSAISEDGDSLSNAGHYTTKMNVIGLNSIEKAIDGVIASFDGDEGDDQVFVQPMLANVAISGVVFSLDPNTSGPYIIVNYDDSSHCTSTVTGGHSNDLKTFVAHRSSSHPKEGFLARVHEMIIETEQLLESETLDIEFAVSGSGELYLLQARNLVINARVRLSQDEHQNIVSTIASRVEALSKPHPYLLGRRTLFGVMPDWNPAEIIGVRPRPLALSLYKELVTDTIWAYQRDNYGYRNLRSFPLVISFFGLPYVDVRVSFNSFIPRGINHGLAERLADYYLDRLAEKPHLHDKVEFDILFSCYTPDLPDRIESLKEYGFSSEDRTELVDGLRNLTNAIINGTNGLWQRDRDRIEELRERHDLILNSDLDAVSRIYWLLEDCKRYGTLPFAGLARAGFIAVQLLNSLLNVGVLGKEGHEAFLGSLNTVSSQLNRDYRALPKEMFLAKYGHLRPGTYDVLSPRYDENPEMYFNWPPSVSGGDEKMTQDFVLSLPQLKSIEALLKEHDLEHDVIGLFDFVKSGIEGREYAKFVFTKSLSDALSLFKELCLSQGFSEDDCSYMNIRTIHDIYSSSVDVEKILRRSADSGRADYAITQQVCLPPLIFHQDNVTSFELPIMQPNFITQKRAVGPVILPSDIKSEFEGSVVMFERADPGYDWIFSKGIAGLITKYGGVNSHMAIRAGELGIPAVIGAGDAHYARWTSAKVIEMDCGNREVRILK